jgi:hypothetical protein
MKLLELTKGKFTKVDDEDFERLTRWKWFASPKRQGLSEFYAARTGYRLGKKCTVWMHREILGAKPGQEVDHINRDCLDNRRLNLRICTHTQNQLNRKLNKNNKTGLRGVSLDSKGTNKKWHATISINGKTKSLGYFKTSQEAVSAYSLAYTFYHAII